MKPGPASMGEKVPAQTDDFRFQIRGEHMSDCNHFPQESQFENRRFAGSYLRLIDFCITQL